MMWYTFTIWSLSTGGVTVSFTSKAWSGATYEKSKVRVTPPSPARTTVSTRNGSAAVPAPVTSLCETAVHSSSRHRSPIVLAGPHTLAPAARKMPLYSVTLGGTSSLR